ncbi:MAG TPA: hypothetical protein VFE32_00660 [Puia sp.]|jgi:hypothetical protein|nr:hypothetical protein [Puia sp.]
MRTLLLLLLAPFGAFAQSTPYYLAGGLNDFSDQMIRGSNPVYVTLFSNDSLIISTSGDAFEHSSAYRRSPGEGFLRRTRQWGTSLPNFVFLYEKAIFLIEEGGSYLVFLKDQDAANGTLAADDKSFLLHMKDSLRSVVVGINTRQRSAANLGAEARNKAIVTAYIRGLHSRRDDPTLAGAIKKWSGNTTTTVYIVDADYYITRNYRGEVLNKNIPALIKYRLNGKCYVQWRAFGYEALGGGTFGKDLYTYNKNDYFIQATGAGGSLRLEPGIAYEIDCE